MKLGRKPRGHDPRVPHMSAVLAGLVLTPPPISVDYSAKLPANLGVMLNDRLGDCTCAAFYHAIQVWSANASTVDTEPDSNVLALYEQACGYNPSDPSTDEGGMEQEVLRFIYSTGAPSQAGPHKIAAYIEVDPRNLDDVRRTINDCGVAYIGFNVPKYLMDSVPALWDVNASADNSIIGGHAIVLIGYDATGPRLISWGQIYQMTWAFFSQFVEEVYALADQSWIESTGNTPAGMTLAQLEDQMTALKAT